MWNLPKKLVSAFSDGTIGTAIVLVHVMMAERVRQRALRQPAPPTLRSSNLLPARPRD